MHHISYQNPENESRSVPTGADDATPLNVGDEMLFFPRVEASSPTTKRGMKIPMVVALMFWVAIMTLELSPFLLILRSNEAAGSATSFPNDNGGDDDDDDDNAFGALWGSSASFAEIVFGIRPCSIEECISSPCQDSKSTRFACLTLHHNTNVRGGCGATPWTHEVCADQCDASVCAYRLSKLEDSSLTESSSSNGSSSSNANSNIPVDHCDVECPKQWCERKRLCGSEMAPYQCTVGDSIYGCSADKFEWTVRSNEVDCSSCCNTSSCS